MHNNTKQF